MISMVDKSVLQYQLPKFTSMDGVWIAGGAIRDSVMNRRFHDIDIFGVSPEKLDAFVARELQDYQKIYDAPGHLLSFKSKEGKSPMRDGSEVKLQVVYLTFDSITKCLEAFDFTICQFGFDGHFVYCSAEALIHEYRQELHPCISGIYRDLLPKTIKRLEKYAKYGYSITSDLIKFLIKDIREMSDQEMKAGFTSLASFEKGNYMEWNLD